MSTRACSPGAILLLALTVMSLPSLTHQQLGSQEWFRRAGLEQGEGRGGVTWQSTSEARHTEGRVSRKLLYVDSMHSQCVDCSPNDLLVAMVKAEGVALQFGEYN